MPLPVKYFQLWERRLVVLRAGGKNDRASWNLLPVVKRDPVWTLVALQARDSVRHHDLRAELLRLRNGSIGEFMARYAGWKSQVVLNL